MRPLYGDPLPRSALGSDVILPAERLLTAYCECAAILRWLVEHDGECLADNPLAMAKAMAALEDTRR